jgi:hypothetical protein
MRVFAQRGHTFFREENAAAKPDRKNLPGIAAISNEDSRESLRAAVYLMTLIAAAPRAI